MSEKRTKLFTIFLIVNHVLSASLNLHQAIPCKVVDRERECFWTLTRLLSDDEFKKYFRFSREAFSLLLETIRPAISSFGPEDEEEELAMHMSGRKLQASLKLGIFLRVMAGGSPWDVSLAFRVGRTTVYAVHEELLLVLDKQLGFQNLPTTDEELKKAALQFTESRGPTNPLPGCVAAVDGLLIQIEKPEPRCNPREFFTRKGFYAVPVQAVVDSHNRFIACSAICAGSTHDSVALELSSIGKYLKDGLLKIGFWIAGDDAYSVSENLIVPISRAVTSVVQDGFNFFHSSHRIHVEQAFGILKKSWGILWRPLHFNLHKATLTISVAMRLQNFSINYDGGISKPHKSRNKWKESRRMLEKWLLWVRDDIDTDADIDFDVPEQCRRSGAPSDEGYIENRSEVRKKLVEWLRRSGLTRPPLERERVSNNNLEVTDTEGYV